MALRARLWLLGLSLLGLWLLGLCAPGAAGRAQASAPGPLLVVVSVDALRHDFLARPQAAFMRSLGDPASDVNAGVGAHSGRLRPQFPSYTFSNHYTMVTGLRPARHGILGNAAYDAGTDKVFRVGTDDVSPADQVWWRAEPVFATAARQGVHAASLAWPGNAVWPHARHRHLRFSKTLGDAERVRTALRWLRETPATRMLHLYFSRVDEAGHDHGPDSRAVAGAIASVDAAMRRLVIGLSRLGRWDNTDLVIVSDHGLSPLVDGCVVDVYQAVPGLKAHVRWLDSHRPVTPVHVVPEHEAAAHALISEAIAEKRLPLSLHWTAALPARLHYAPGPRTAHLLLAAHAGCTLGSAEQPRPRPERGSHGYDPAAVEDMDGIVVARGPRIARGPENRLGGPGAAWDNVDVYDLTCRLADLACLPHDGSGVLADALLARDVPEVSARL